MSIKETKTQHNTMGNSKSLFFLIIFTVLISFSSAQGTVKGGYWYSDSGLDVSDIDSSYFTHLFCAFADLDTQTSQVTISSSNEPSFSTFTQTVQQNNPSVKTLLSIGGGGGPSLAANFAGMASQASTRKSFIDSSIQVARNYNFHGLDLDWEYPSNDTDKTNFGLLLNEWRSAITQESTTSGNSALLLTAAVSGSNQISLLEYYPAQDIANNFDWVNIMVYDLFTPGGYSTQTQPPAPLKNPQGQFSGEEGIASWIQLGVPANKLAIGLPFYGYAWNLVNANDHGLFATANGADTDVTSSGDGSIGYGDIREFINTQSGVQCVYNSTFVTDYCYSGTTWIGYDDTQSISAKVTYAKDNGLVGYFAWQIGSDDSWTLSKTASNAWGS
ncbi:putative glycoside hydrolase family 18, catalytic domain, glycoside hydrolase superfamily [Lupinus albus]|uniref:Putative glycoside hydrolase family 18, catalytic domain, glycoside hydrolase superfamily n=1 Tax=Lupinus albus TaxID=3870 RepID=A0A6A4Q7G1_LUPAL|nr:putative glycoside hydrolase family 18, catalytic domain, glycoside hydrolase superfamily [Lupinus albus]